MSWDFFVKRPVFATVLSLMILLGGINAFRVLPVAQYPQIAPPIITITASYLGASPETLIKTVAAPIEQQINGAEHLLYFASTASSTGALTIMVTFEPGSDANAAMVDLNNRVNIALPRLPDEVRRNGVVVKRRSSDILLTLTLNSKDGSRDTIFLSNYASVYVLEEILRVPGVADAGLLGGRDYAMRVWLEPDKMARLGVTAGDVAKAIQVANNQYAAGRVGQEPSLPDQALAVPIITEGRLTSAQQFGQIVVRSGGPQGTLYLKDIARLELAAESYEQQAKLDGNNAVAIRVYLTPDANALVVGDAIRAKLKELSKRFPAGVDYDIPFDTTLFINASMHEVAHTLVEAAILVLLVVFLFLGNWRATIIPMISVPVSLIGAMMGLWFFGFGINTLTMFALVVAIGIVVDDAIVVLENVERLMQEEHMTPLEAATASVKEVGGALIAIVLVLVSVFLPVAFLGGIAGTLYRQFAVTVSVAVIISGFVALTLTPTLCAYLLKATQHHGSENRGGFLGWFEDCFKTVAHFHNRTVKWLVAHPVTAFSLFGLILLANAVLLKLVPRGFIPNEDQGYLLGIVSLPDGASGGRTRKYMDDITPGFMNYTAGDKPVVEHALAVSGFDRIGGGEKTNAGTIFLPLIDWKAREQNAETIAKGLNLAAGKIPDGNFVAVNPPPIRGIGTAGGFEFYLQARQDDDPVKLGLALNKLLAALRARPEFSRINSYFRTTAPEYHAKVDQVKVSALGVELADVYQALQATIGTLYVNDFNLNGRPYRVFMQAETAERMTARDISRAYVRSRYGDMVPLSTFVTITDGVGPDQIDRYQGFVSALVLGDPVPGISSGQAIQIVEEVAEQVLPAGYEVNWTAQALQEKRSASSAVPAFTMAMLMVFLILAALYEKWSLPFGVILTVPFALLGALIAVFVRGMPNDIYFQIGLVTLIGLAAKNAILIVAFAVKARDEGRSAAEAAVEAARIRFRPLVMTSMAFVLGVVPLAIAVGAGAAARRSMGTGVFGGMLLDTFVATLFIPLFFKVLTGDRKETPSTKPAA